MVSVESDDSRPLPHLSVLAVWCNPPDRHLWSSRPLSSLCNPRDRIWRGSGKRTLEQVKPWPLWTAHALVSASGLVQSSRLTHVCCLFRTVRFRLCLLCRLMVWKGWTQVEVLSGWVQILRGPRPKSEQWPKQSKSISKGKGRGQQRQFSVSPPQTRHDPDSVMSNARSRIAKLEAAMVAVGESDATYPSLFDALQKARALAGVQPVQDRIASTESFITRARKRVETERKGVETAKAELAKAEAKLAFEEDELSKAEHRLVALQQEAKTVLVSPFSVDPSRVPPRVQENAGSRRIAPGGALSIEVGASWCPSDRTRFERGRCIRSSPRASGEVGGGSPWVRGERDQETHS